MLTKRQQAKLARRVTSHRVRLHQLSNHLMTLDLNRQDLRELLAALEAADKKLSGAVLIVDTFHTIRSEPPS